MPRVRELDLSQEHVLCYACNTWREYKNILTHWVRAKHKETHGIINIDRLQPQSLFDISRIPILAPTFHNVNNKCSPEQPQEEDEPLEPFEDDEDYPGAGMRGCCYTLMSSRPSNNAASTLQTPLS